MNIKVPVQMYKTPKRIERRHKDGDQAGQLNGLVTFLHSVILEGEQVDFFADTDLTSALNGQRDGLDRGEAVPVFAELDVSGYRGKLSPRVTGLAAREGK